jgi:hypothetical protein
MKGLLFSAFGVALASCVEGQPLPWRPVGPPGSPSILAMATATPNGAAGLRLPSVLFAASVGAGVLRSDDAGNSWNPTGPGLEGHDAVALAVKQVFTPCCIDYFAYRNTIFAGTSGAGVYRLLPDATAWAPAVNGLVSLDLRSLMVDSAGVVYAGTASGLFASAHEGDSWSPKGTGLPSGADAAISALAGDPSSPSRFYAGTGKGLFRSEDGGGTWSKLDTGSTFILSVSAVAVDPLAPSRVYVAGFKTYPCSPFCLPIAFLPVALRSADGGASWLPIGALDGNFVRSFAATSTLPARVFAGTTSNGVFESSDAGVTWAASNGGLGSTPVSSLVIDAVLPSFLYAATLQGVFSAPLGQVALACSANAETLCLNGLRFRAIVVWRATGGPDGYGRAFPITENTGAFWFFEPMNLELVVKVLDARSVNGKFWVFYGSLTNVEFTLYVVDTLTGAMKTYVNPQGQMASVADTSAF